MLKLKQIILLLLIMNITYIGHSSFRIKNKLATIITDPFSNEIGINFPKQEADLVTISHAHKDHNNRAGIKNEDAFFIEGPGEYEVKDVMIRGIESFHDDKKGAERGKNTIYMFEIDGIYITHLGDLGHELTDAEVKEIEKTNILMVPIGGVYTIDPVQAAKVTRNIDPQIILPMHYKTPELSETFKDLKTISDFANEMQLEPVEMDKLSIKINELPEEMKLVYLH